MIQRIISAFTFNTGVYKEVEEDAAFTPTAWMIVAVVSFFSQLGAYAIIAKQDGGRWILGAFGGTVFALVGFALGALIISWAGKTFFNAQVTFEELVRTLGLAYVWNIIGFLGIVALVGPASACITGPIRFIAGIMGLIAWFVAAKEALDLEWPQPIGTVIIGWVATLVVSMIASAVMALFWLVPASVQY